MKKRIDPERSERLHEENRKLKDQIEKLKADVKKLKSENKTLQVAWKKSEFYLKDVTDGRSVEEIVKNVAKGRKLPKLESFCSKCDKNNISIMKYSNFRLIICSDCGFKEKIDGSGNSEQE